MTEIDKFPPVEQLVLSAVQSLVEDTFNEAALLLLSCTFAEYQSDYDNWNGGQWNVHLRGYGPKQLRDVLNDDDHYLTKQILQCINMILPLDMIFQGFYIGAPLVPVTPELRQMLTNLAQGKTITNQGNVREGETFILWNNLRFRSIPERAIAEALDKRSVFFLPNCLGRLTSLDGLHRNCEADFLVCHQGRWGILEVDGDTYHPPERIAEEQDRDRLFRQYSIRPVEHYQAARCLQEPDAVVAEFLLLLQRQHAT